MGCGFKQVVEGMPLVVMQPVTPTFAQIPEFPAKLSPDITLSETIVATCKSSFELVTTLPLVGTASKCCY
jgi:hypothetical protein